MLESISKDLSLPNTLSIANTLSLNVSHYHAICTGDEGLGFHAIGASVNNSVVQHEGVLAYILRSLLQYRLL